MGEMRRADQRTLEAMPPSAADAIFEDIALGTDLNAIAERLGVRRFSLCAWIDNDQERISRYERARRYSATALVEQSLHLADNAEVTVPALMKAKLQIQTRNWIARAWDRGQYGAEVKPVSTTVNYAEVHINALRHRTLKAQAIDATEVLEIPPDGAAE